jgi:phosphate-selective porin
MSHKIITPTLMLVAAISLTSCSSGITNSGSQGGTSNAQSPPAATPKKGFDADLEYVRKGQYTYIWVFSRKDGKTIDKEDAAFLRTNAPQVVDWVTTDEGRKVIAGTNFDLAKGNLDLLKKRFNVENYTGR